MFLGGWIFSVGIMAAYLALRIFPGILSFYLPELTLIVITGTLVESLPFRDVDNITVTFAALVSGHSLF